MVLIAVFIPAHQMGSVLQAFACCVAPAAWSCFSLAGEGERERGASLSASLGPARTRTGQEGLSPRLAPSPSPHSGAPGLGAASCLGRGQLGCWGAGVASSPWNHSSLFPATPTARKASVSSLGVQSGLAWPPSGGTS